MVTMTRPNYVGELEKMLSAVPEVDLDPDYLKWTKEKVAARAKEILAENKEEKDKFIRNLKAKRDDLAGLPFLLGKDCAIADKEARSLAEASLQVRSNLAA